LIQRQVGGNMTEITDKISHTIRERLRIQGEIQTLTAQGRLSGTIIGLLPFGLAGFMYLTNKSYLMPLFTEPLGKLLIVIALFGEALGAWAISRIIKIEV
jgi:tight adherence protein B